jgi:hypothetical protein
MPADATSVAITATRAAEQARRNAWRATVAHLDDFDSAVLTGQDTQGYPFSLRCHPLVDAGARMLRIQAPPGTPLQPGHAGLLCHKHDEWLWHQRSFLVRGALLPDREGWGFRPEEHIQGAGYGGLLGLARFVARSRRNARAYLAARGLPRPRIPWDQIVAAKRQSLPATGGKARVAVIFLAGGSAVLALALVMLLRRGWVRKRRISSLRLLHGSIRTAG